MVSLDVAVALRMVVSGAAMRDPQAVQGFDVSRRSKLRAVVGRQSQTRSTPSVSTVL